MNRAGSASKSMEPLYLQVPSHHGQDAQETGFVSSLHSLGNARLKREREETQETEQAQQAQDYKSEQSVPGNSAALEPQKPVFKVRPLSLDRGAIAPGLATPTAPFAKSERKKAYVSAIYYSECFLRKIEPKEADLAAFNVQKQYNKWWVRSKKAKPPSSDSAANSKRKRRRLEGQTETPTAKYIDEVPCQALPTTWDPEVVTLLKETIVEKLQKTGGDTSTTEFQRCLEQLQAAYAANQERMNMAPVNGTWLTLTKPSFAECQGRNEHGEYLYSLGRMSFDMFRPTHLRCSIRAVMNNICPLDPNSKPKSFPKRLDKHLKDHRHNLDNPIRHYDIIVAFTIEANQTRDGKAPSGNDQEFVIPRPIRGLMTNYGYMVDDPDTPDRNSIWFSGGSIEVQDEVEDAAVWTQIFDESLAPSRDTQATANVVAAKLLLGAHTTTTSHAGEDTDLEGSVPTMSYHFKRPIGGHGEVYCDVLYYDEELRITRGHYGSIFVSTRVPEQ